MNRLRVLAVVLGCLAAFWASGLPVVAFASAPAANAGHMNVTERCHGCPDCDGAPCTPAAMACSVACLGSLPTLAVAALAPPTIETGKIAWPASLAILHGRSPPPDPFPPRL